MRVLITCTQPDFKGSLWPSYDANIELARNSLEFFFVRWYGKPGVSQVTLLKNPPGNAREERNSDLIPGLGRSPGEGNGYPLLYSCLENPIDRENWWATVHGVAKSQTQLNA